MTAVPHGDVVGDTGKETALSDTESHTDGKKTSIIVDNTHESRANTWKLIRTCDDSWEIGIPTPHNHNNRNPE